MNQHPVFVLITADNCPGCINFKSRIWPSLKSKLESDGKVQVVTIELPTTNSKPDPVKYHKDLVRFIGWFPTMVLFPADRWNNHSSDLIGIIKNGRMVPPSKDENGNEVPAHVEPISKFNLSEEDVLKWIDFTINDPDGMFVRLKSSAQNSVSNSNSVSAPIVNEKREKLNKLPDGKFMVPTAGYYANFDQGRVR